MNSRKGLIHTIETMLVKCNPWTQQWTEGKNWNGEEINAQASVIWMVPMEKK